jgi:vitamin B12 transporter
MKKTIMVIMLAGVGLVSSYGQGGTADKEVVVSATRVPTARETVGGSITVITADDIERTRKHSMTEILRDVPGLHVAQNGGRGMLASVYMRGAEPEQILVLVDGVEVNDPIAPGRGAFVPYLDMENVERIEVLRGAQSGLYGSDAIAGVISIMTKKGDGAPTAYVSAEGGSFDTFRESVGVSGSENKVNYSISATRVDSDGISAAREEDGNTEEDGYEHTSVSARLGVTPNDACGLDLTVRYIDSEADYDESGGPGGDAVGNVSMRESMLVSLQGTLDMFDAALHQRLGVSVADHDRGSVSSWGNNWFNSEWMKIDWQGDYHLEDINVLTLGFEVEDEQGESDTISKVTSDTTSLYVQDKVKLGAAHLTAGGRIDDRDGFDSETTYRVSPVYIFDKSGTRLHGTYSTGFKAPSLYQLYAPAMSWGPIGNPNLKPEESEGWEVGVSQELVDQMIVLSAAYFDVDYKDMIDFENGYVNKSRVETSGMEVMAGVRPSESLEFGINYTYTKAEDKVTGLDKLRRPSDEVTASCHYDWSQKGSVTLGLLYVGKRDDRVYNPTMFTYTGVELSAYTVLNVATVYDVTESFQLFGRIENVFDEDYEELAGYGTAGASAYAGFKLVM